MWVLIPAECKKTQGLVICDRWFDYFGQHYQSLLIYCTISLKIELYKSNKFMESFVVCHLILKNGLVL